MQPTPIASVGREGALEATATAGTGRSEVGDIARWPTEAAQAIRANSYRLVVTLANQQGDQMLIGGSAWMTVPLKGRAAFGKQALFVTASHVLTQTDGSQDYSTLVRVELYHPQTRTTVAVPAEGIRCVLGTHEFQEGAARDVAVFAVDLTGVQFPGESQGIAIRAGVPAMPTEPIYGGGFPIEMGGVNPPLYGTTLQAMNASVDGTWITDMGYFDHGISGGAVVNAYGEAIGIFRAIDPDRPEIGAITPLSQHDVAHLLDRLSAPK